MVSIENIFELFDWNNSIEKQRHGRELAQKYHAIDAFLQPCGKKYNKNVWDNCALILADRSDEELAPYSIQLLEWIADLNWPGAICIFERLKRFEYNQQLNSAISSCARRAQELEDEQWMENIKEVQKARNNMNSANESVNAFLPPEEGNR